MKLYTSQLQALAKEFRDEPDTFAEKASDYFLVRAPGRPTSPVLRIYGPGLREDAWELPIGRERDRSKRLFIDERSISRYHAKLSYLGVVYIEDLNSSNGTFVNGEKITAGKQRPIEAGDTLKFGTEEWELHDYATLRNLLQRKHERKSDSNVGKLEELVRV